MNTVFSAKAPENLTMLIKRLGSDVIDYRFSSADMESLSKIQLVSNQQNFLPGMVYIGNQSLFLKMTSVHTFAGTILISCKAKEPKLMNSVKFENAALIEASCSVASMFNTINQILSRSAISASPDMKTGLQHVWDQIINCRLLAKQDIIDALVNAGSELQPFYRVIVIAFSDTNTDTTTYMALRDKIKRILPSTEVFRDNKSLVVLLFHKERTLDPLFPLDEIHDALKEYRAYMIIGHAGRDYSMVRTQFLICQRSLDIAMHLSKEPDRFIFNINDYAMYYAIDMCAQRCYQVFGHMDIILLVHPSIVAIRRYDIKHKTDLLEVLHHYIRNSGSLAKTSEEMFMHRNTVHNKISRLRSMLPFDLDDGSVRQLLLFSYQTLQFYEKILNFEIKKM